MRQPERLTVELPLLSMRTYSSRLSQRSVPMTRTAGPVVAVAVGVRVAVGVAVAAGGWVAVGVGVQVADGRAVAVGVGVARTLSTMTRGSQ